MKVLIISHISDPDGIVPVILSKLVFEEVTSMLFESSTVNEGVLALINNHEFDNYDLVYITDLGLNEELLSLIDNDIVLRTKVKLFDHHIGNTFANKYTFAKVIDVDQTGKKQSGTSLYYEYLLSTYGNAHLKKESVRYFVNLVREYDTWEWVKTNNQDAKRQGNLFDIYGYQYFEKHFLSFLKENDTFFFDEKQLYLLEIEQKRIDLYIEEKKDSIISVTLLGYNVGLVFATQYRSELGNALAKYFESLYDFIALINIERSISYRGIKEIDLNEIAKVFGGKGHAKVSGSPILPDIREKIIKLIFEDKIIINKDNH